MNSITAAKNRRVNPPSSTPPPPPQNTYINKYQQNTPNTANVNTQNKDMNTTLTLPQVIKLVDIRLSKLEKEMIEIKTNSSDENSQNMKNSIPFSSVSLNDNNILSQKLKETIDEFDKRYEMLAQEIIDLKNIVLSLQSYTLDVNKMLMEERTHIMEELSKNEQEKQQESFQEPTQEPIQEISQENNINI